MTESTLRAGLTQTKNAYERMAGTVEELVDMASELEAIRQANLDHHARLIAAAAEQGVRVLGLGELFAGPYFALETQSMWRGLAESSVDGPSVRFLQQQAAAHEMVVVAPIYERAGDKFFNTAVFIDADGQRLGHYRKVHIPKGKNETGGFDEAFYYQASEGQAQEGSLSENPFFPVFQSRYARIGAAICFDRHFQGVMSELARGGAELVFSPAVTFGRKSQRLWAHEFQTDATRNQIFIGGSNRKGSEAPWNIEYFGESHFVGPNGPRSNCSTHPELVIADLPLAELHQPDPAGWNLLENRRSDCY